MLEFIPGDVVGGGAGNGERHRQVVGVFQSARPVQSRQFGGFNHRYANFFDLWGEYFKENAYMDIC